MDDTKNIKLRYVEYVDPRVNKSMNVYMALFEEPTLKNLNAKLKEEKLTHDEFLTHLLVGEPAGALKVIDTIKGLADKGILFAKSEDKDIVQFVTTFNEHSYRASVRFQEKYPNVPSHPRNVIILALQESMSNMKKPSSNMELEKLQSSHTEIPKFGEKTFS